MTVSDGGPWRGPSEEDWLDRINDGANRAVLELLNDKMSYTMSGGHWSRPWIGNDNRVPNRPEQLEEARPRTREKKSTYGPTVIRISTREETS